MCQIGTLAPMLGGGLFPDYHHMMFSKKETERDLSYLKYIRTCACLLCGRSPVEAHHCNRPGDGGTGIKASDYRAVPLCWEHHRGGGVPGKPGSVHQGGKNLFKRHKIDIEKEIARLVTGFFL